MSSISQTKVLVVMDPLEAISYHKDSTLPMLMEAQSRYGAVWVAYPQQLFVEQGKAKVQARKVQVRYQADDYFTYQSEEVSDLHEFNIILMRLDPPFDMEYVTLTWMLEQAERRGSLVVNKCQALRDHNEKFSISHFPDLAPNFLITKDQDRILQWLEQQESTGVDSIIKPLDGMGGREIFRLNRREDNCKVIVESVTHHGEKSVMIQRYLPEIKQGDKRVWIIHGKPLDYFLARIPHGDARGNLDKGAIGVLKPMTDIERNIGEQVGSWLLKQGVYFAGLDVIGECLTEINITSPTGIRDLEPEGVNASAMIFDGLEPLLAS